MQESNERGRGEQLETSSESWPTPKDIIPKEGTLFTGMAETQNALRWYLTEALRTGSWEVTTPPLHKRAVGNVDMDLRGLPLLNGNLLTVEGRPGEEIVRPTEELLKKLREEKAERMDKNA